MKCKLLQEGYSDMDINRLVTSSLWDSFCDAFGCKTFNYLLCKEPQNNTAQSFVRGLPTIFKTHRFLVSSPSQTGHLLA